MTDPAGRVDDHLIARCRTDLDQATDPGEVATLTRILERLCARRGMPLDQFRAEIQAELRDAEHEEGKAAAYLSVIRGGYLKATDPMPGSYAFRCWAAPPSDTAKAVEPAWRVLDCHARLHDVCAHPNDFTTGLTAWFAEEYADTASNWLSKYMFWPYHTGGQRSRDGWEKHFLVQLARGLFTAVTYQVTPPMCEIAEAMYEQTAKVNGCIEPEDLPSETGFLWLDRPFWRPDAKGEFYQTRAVTWQPASLRREGDDPEDGVRITLWGDFEESPDQTVADLPAEAGPLVMVMTVVVPFGADFSGLDASGVPTPLHYVHAVWLLIGTELAAVTRGSIIRQARKRALRSLQQNDVSVVILRRAAHAPGDDECSHREVDWSCRWIVRGFWRHQWGYGTVGHFHQGRSDGGDPPRCLTCGARVTWVRPYVKGPDDRPLKATRMLYRLSR